MDVSIIECSTAKDSAPARDLKACDTFIFIFAFLMAPSLALLSEGISLLKRKVSQAFRSRAGAESFAVLHSVMDTAKKNGMPIFQAIKSVVEYQPIVLPE